MESAHEELESRFKDLEARFLSRESRPEDVERIRFLEAEMVKKDAEIKSVREEMRYFKLELLNREENFNSKFAKGNLGGGGGMNVGVMQVIKPKGKGGKGGKGSRAGGRGSKGGRRDSSGITPGLRRGGVGSGSGPGRPSSDSVQKHRTVRESQGVLRGQPTWARRAPSGGAEEAAVTAAVVTAAVDPKTRPTSSTLSSASAL